MIANIFFSLGYYGVYRVCFSLVVAPFELSVDQYLRALGSVVGFSAAASYYFVISRVSSDVFRNWSTPLVCSTLGFFVHFLLYPTMNSTVGPIFAFYNQLVDWPSAGSMLIYFVLPYFVHSLAAERV